MILPLNAGNICINLISDKNAWIYNNNECKEKSDHV